MKIKGENRRNSHKVENFDNQKVRGTETERKAKTGMSEVATQDTIRLIQDRVGHRSRGKDIYF